MATTWSRASSSPRASADGPGRLCSNEVIGALNKIIANTTRAAGAPAEDILAMTVVGNTTMQHLFLGISPAALAQAPYVPVTSDAACVRAADLGISIYPEAHVWALAQHRRLGGR